MNEIQIKTDPEPLLIWRRKLVFFGRTSILYTYCAICDTAFIPIGREMDCDECSERSPFSRREYPVHVEYEILDTEWRSPISGSRSHANYALAKKRDGKTCQYCGWSRKCRKHPRRLTIDHVKPFAAGGSNEIDNLVVACSLCNSLASSSVFETFMAKREYLRERLSVLGEPLFDDDI